MNAQSEESASYYDEIDPIGIWLKIKPGLFRYKYTIMVVTALFMVLGYFLSGFQSPQWEAASSIRIGRLSPSAFVEPLESVIMRSRTPEFQLSVLEKCGLPSDSSGADLYRKTLHLQQINTGMLGLTVRGLSRDSAFKLSSATMEEIRAGHSLIISRRLSAPKLRLAAIGKLDRALAPARAAAEMRSLEDKSLAAVVAAYLAYETGQLRTTLRDEVDFLELNSTVLIAEDGGSAPVSPRKKLWTVYSGMAGFLLSAAVYLLVSRRKSLTN